MREALKVTNTAILLFFLCVYCLLIYFDPTIQRNDAMNDSRIKQFKKIPKKMLRKKLKTLGCLN